MIASAEASDRLALPSDGPSLERKQWMVKPCLTPEFGPILDRIGELVVGGLTSMHVLGDFLKRRVMPLQGRPRMSCWFTGPNDIGRIHHGPRTDLTWEEIELLVRGVTGEAFIPEFLMLPQGISPLCNNPGLRSAVLARLSTLDESGVAVCQTCGWDPHRGIHILGVPGRGSQPANVAPRVPSAVPSPSDKGKGPASSSSAPDIAGRSEEARRHRLRRANGSFVGIFLEIRVLPRSVRKQLVGLRSPNLESRMGRGARALHHYHLQIRYHLRRLCQANRYRRRGSDSNISKGSSSNNNNMCPASKATGRFTVPSKLRPSRCSFDRSLYVDGS
jgi:hypothetical protein